MFFWIPVSAGMTNIVNPVRNSSGALNPAGIIIKPIPAAEQRGVISNGVKGFITHYNRLPNSDLENKTLPLSSHCESRQKREKMRACTPKCSVCLREAALAKAGRASVAISLKKTRLLRFTRNNNFPNRDLGAWIGLENSHP